MHTIGNNLQAPLVGSQAPDFAATAVYDQEFMDIKLSQYKVRLLFPSLASFVFILILPIIPLVNLTNLFNIQ
jgi:alkyl hydroperoxide reductase subunit AhpC